MNSFGKNKTEMTFRHFKARARQHELSMLNKPEAEEIRGVC